MNKQKSNLIHKPQFKPPTIKSPNPGLTTKSPTTASILAPTFHWQVVVDICILTLSFAQIFVPVEISIVRSDFCISTWLVLCKNCIRIQFWHQYQPDRPRLGDLRGWTSPGYKWSDGTRNRRPPPSLTSQMHYCIGRLSTEQVVALPNKPAVHIRNPSDATQHNLQCNQQSPTVCATAAAPPDLWARSHAAGTKCWDFAT